MAAAGLRVAEAGDRQRVSEGTPSAVDDELRAVGDRRARGIDRARSGRSDVGESAGSARGLGQVEGAARGEVIGQVREARVERPGGVLVIDVERSRAGQTADRMDRLEPVRLDGRGKIEVEGTARGDGDDGVAKQGARAAGSAAV